MSEPAVGALVRALLDDGAVRLLLVEATGPAEHTRQIHGLSRDAARLGAEAVVAAALNSAHVKGGEQMSLQLQGEQPRCAVYADVTADGQLRARITPTDLRLRKGRLDGTLLAVKSLDGRELYRGVTSVTDCSLEHALAQHLASSVQVDDVFRIGVRQDDEGRILQAGGLLLERLPAPEVDAEGVSVLEPEAFWDRYGWVRDADITQLLGSLAFGSLGDVPLRVLEQRTLRWQCRCSRDRIASVLRSLGPTEIRAMIDEDGGAEVVCHFCNTAYAFDVPELQALLG
ncbi:MAG: Hsp33 family molecular chaperone HslO [Myxococcales bacterium]|nr:Hsp33 family molecular chaperone HslO [Myxococcales bacterium]